MLASTKEDYHVVPKNVQNDPQALILDLQGLLIHKVDLEEDIFFPPWNLEYDQVLQERPRRIYFLVRPDARQFLLWEANHFHVFIWSSAMEHNIVKRFRECFLGLRGLMAGFLA